MAADFLERFYADEITDLLNDTNRATHVSINIELSKLQNFSTDLFSTVLENPHTECSRWDEALLDAQKKLLEGNAFLDPGFQIKENCHVRFIGYSSCAAAAEVGEDQHQQCYPNSTTNHRPGSFIELQGTVVRMTQAKLLELRREYVCNRCKRSQCVRADYTRMFAIDPARSCSVTCRGTMQPVQVKPQPQHCIDYQEIRIQEIDSERTMPASVVVTLENDLVDVAQPGDNVTICGTVELRWKLLGAGKRPEVVMTIRALSLTCKGRRTDAACRGMYVAEQLAAVEADWQDVVDRLGGYQGARDMIVQSFCPDIHGMHLVKLAIVLALSSGSFGATDDGATVRGNSHLLLVGDPGLAKSKLLRFAANIMNRSVMTTGMGCSAAGLTAAAVKENGEWTLQAGALVLADGGVCCIDEFSLMRASDKCSIHEAMEQQTISISKAGIVCQLRTRCIILAATNPVTTICQAESAGGVTGANIGITSPLLSRFDIILIIRDEHDPVWDDRVADHLLLDNGGGTDFGSPTSTNTWNVERLQNHFMAIRNVTPRMTTAASDLLGKYYVACRGHENRNPSRTTVRLLDSLSRLAQAHARLVFRPEVTAEDAVAVIRLMESTWGFGFLLQPENVLKRRPPLGPTAAEIQEVRALLGIENGAEEITTDFSDQVPSEHETISSPPQGCSTIRSIAEANFSETPTENVENKRLKLNGFDQFAFGKEKMNRKQSQTVLSEQQTSNIILPVEEEIVNVPDVSSAKAEKSPVVINQRKELSNSTVNRLHQFKNVNFVDPLSNSNGASEVQNDQLLELPAVSAQELPATLPMGSLLSLAWKNDNLDCLDDLDF